MPVNVEVAVFRTVPQIVVETIDPTDPDNRWSRTWELFEFPLEYLRTASPGAQWSERPRASFTVSPEDFVSDVLAQAADSLGVSWTATADEFFGEQGGFAYRQRDLRFALDDHGTVPLLAMVDELGRATFNVFPDDVRFADVARAQVVGLYEGDPQRLALIIDPFPGVEGGGGNGFSLWQNVLDVYTNVRPWMESGLLFSGAIATLWGTYKGAAKFIRRHAPSLERRSTGLTQVEALARLAKDPEQLGKVLGIPTGEAADLLVTLGLRANRDTDTPDSILARRVTAVTAKVSTHFHLEPENLAEACKRASLVPFDGDELALESTVTGIFEDLTEMQNRQYWQ